jgi:hypothetical protein
MRRSLIAFLAALSLVVVDTATATPPEIAFAVGSAPMQIAQQMAKAHWGTDPCGGQVTIAWSQLPAETNAVSSWTSPGGGYDHPELNGDCTITYNPAAEFDWPKFCTVTIHEYGHLSGRPHSADPADVMSAYYTQPGAECVVAESRPVRRKHRVRRVRRVRHRVRHHAR